MIGKCFAIFTSASFVYAAAVGRLGALSTAILDGASKSVTLSFSLLGMMCLWGGIMSLLSAAGMISRLSRILRPVLQLAFPNAFKTGVAADEITACVSANLLGIGNAATPLAISAMRRMRESAVGDEATDDMVTLAVMGTASFNIFPSTIIALRRAAGSADPYAVIIPIWITSALCCIFGVTLCRIIAAVSHRRARSCHD